MSLDSSMDKVLERRREVEGPEAGVRLCQRAETSRDEAGRPSDPVGIVAWAMRALARATHRGAGPSASGAPPPRGSRTTNGSERGAEDT